MRFDSDGKMPFVCTICNVASKPVDCALTCCFQSFGLHAPCLHAYWLSEQDIKCPNCKAEVPEPIQDMVSTALSRAAQPGKKGAEKVKKNLRKHEMPAAPKKKPKPLPKQLPSQSTTTKTKAAPPKKTIKQEGLEGQTFTCPGGYPHCRPSGCRNPWKGKVGKQQYTRHMENKHGWPKSGLMFVAKTSKMYIEGCKYCAKGFRNQRDLDHHVLSDRHKDHSKEKEKSTTTENATTTVEVEFGAPMLASQVVPVAQQDWPERTPEEEAAWCIEKCIELLENAPPEFNGIQLKLCGMGSWISNYRYGTEDHLPFLVMPSDPNVQEFCMGICELLFNQPGNRFRGMNCLDACNTLFSETDGEGIPPKWHDLLSQHGKALEKELVP